MVPTSRSVGPFWSSFGREFGEVLNEQPWHQARLIPTSGINGAEEQERRATSALLAVMSAVKEFGRTLTHRYGAPSGPLETFIEVPFLLGDKKVFPDGLIRVSRGGRTWTALVEVKTGTNVLVADQLESYLDVAREQGFDALITISNEIPPIPGVHPTKVDKRKLRKVALHHLSWTRVLHEAVIQKEVRGVADPDQAWILGELIRYLEHPRSGALEFEDMGEAWVSVRNGVTAGTLRATDKGVDAVVARFDALMMFASLRLGRRLGTEVTPVLSRRELADPVLRSQALIATLVAQGQLSAVVRVPDTVGSLVVTADVRAGTVTCHVDVDAPREGRAMTRVNWLVRQLKEAPDAVRIEAFVAHGRGSSAAELLRDVRTNASLLTPDPRKELRSFRVAAVAPLGAKRGRGRGSFIDSVLEAVDGFYTDVMQNLRPWTANPPRLRPPDTVVADGQQIAEPLISTALSSQDGTLEPGSDQPAGTRDAPEGEVPGALDRDRATPLPPEQAPTDGSVQAQAPTGVLVDATSPKTDVDEVSTAASAAADGQATSDRAPRLASDERRRETDEVVVDINGR